MMNRLFFSQHHCSIAPDYGPADIDLHADGLLRCMAGDLGAADGWMPFTRFDPDAAMIEAGCILTAWRRYVAAYTADEIAAEGTPIKLEALVSSTNLPSTQVNVALAFMLERGCLVTENRIHYPATGNQKPGQIALDAITEYYALAEGSPGSQQPDLPEGVFDGEEA